METAIYDLVKPRRKSRQIRVGSVTIGGDAPVRVQSMTTTDTADVAATARQIAALAAAGCEIVRVAVPHAADAEALKRLAPFSPVPLIADIHFEYKLALTALEAGIHGLRWNPGNITREKIRTVVTEAKARGVPIRIGVNAGSLEKDVAEKYCKPVAEALVESALQNVRTLEDLDFHDIKISVKASDVPTMVASYRLLGAQCDYPLHLGVTEAGPIVPGSVKSAVAMGVLLSEGIGDTIRVSLTDDPVEEVKVGFEILKALGVREAGPDLIACPTCGRVEVDIIEITKRVEKRVQHIKHPFKVALMGCVVNGPGEAKEADIGIAAGKGRGLLFKRGVVVARVKEEEMEDALVREIEAMAAERDAQDKAP